MNDLAVPTGQRVFIGGQRTPCVAEKGIAPVVGVTLLFTLMVLLSASAGYLVTGYDDQLIAPAPPMTFETDYDPSRTGNSNRPYVNITRVDGEVADGEAVLIKDDPGNSVQWAAI